MIQEFVGCNVVMGGVETYVFRRNAGHMSAKLIYSMKKTDAIMPLSGKKFHKNRYFSLIGIVTGAEHIERPSKEPVLFVAVPTPIGIRIREMSWAIVIKGAIYGGVTTLLVMTKGTCMNSNRSTIPR